MTGRLDMRMLMLGGTAFLGRALVDDALARGWEVTTLNRGTTAPVAGVEAITADRTRPGAMDDVAGQHWDVVVDTWSAQPAVVWESAHALAATADRYAYVSSRSVYAWPIAAGANEDAPVVDADPRATTSDDYARAKRGAELAVLDAFGNRSLLGRAGLILGPWSNIGRLQWWLERMAAGGDVLAPGPADLPLQLIDTRDLAAWLLTAATDSSTTGRPGGTSTGSGSGALGAAQAVDLVSPSGHATMATFLAACHAATGSDATLHWVDADAITTAGIEPWTQLPVWTPPGELHDALHASDVDRAVAAGLTCRPVTETVADTWAWMQAHGAPTLRPDRPRHGLDPALEHGLLVAQGHLPA